MKKMQQTTLLHTGVRLILKKESITMLLLVAIPVLLGMAAGTSNSNNDQEELEFVVLELFK